MRFNIYYKIRYIDNQFFASTRNNVPAHIRFFYVCSSLGLIASFGNNFDVHKTTNGKNQSMETKCFHKVNKQVNKNWVF